MRMGCRQHSTSFRFLQAIFPRGQEKRRGRGNRTKNAEGASFRAENGGKTHVHRQSRCHYRRRAGYRQVHRRGIPQKRRGRLRHRQTALRGRLFRRRRRRGLVAPFRRFRHRRARPRRFSHQQRPAAHARHRRMYLGGIQLRPARGRDRAVLPHEAVFCPTSRPGRPSSTSPPRATA